MSNKLRSILKTKFEQFKGNPKGFFDDIENIRAEDEVVILASGPTISKYSEEQFSKFFENKDIFSIKQCYSKFPEQTDVHFFNCSNLPIDETRRRIGYTYPEDSPFVIASSNFLNGGGRWSQDQFKNIFFKIPTLQHSSKDFLFHTGKLNENKFCNTLSRPCGPGIMLETVLYFAVHLGYKSIYTIGWDYTGNNGKYGHFYNKGDKAKKVAIPGDIFKGELEAMLPFTDTIAEWLEENNTNLKVVGNLSIVSDKFQRVEI